MHFSRKYKRTLSVAALMATVAAGILAALNSSDVVKYMSIAFLGLSGLFGVWYVFVFDSRDF